MTKEKMMTAEDYKEFGKLVGIPIKTAKYSTDDGTFNSDNEYLTIMNTARVKRMDLLEYYDSRQNILDIERDTLVFVIRRIKTIQKRKRTQRFYRLIRRLYCTRNQSKVLKHLFIDEAQDLSLIQWDMVRSIVG